MLVALWDVSNQFNDNNGSILTNGKVYVYYSGRAALAPTWSSADGSHVNSNPIILDNNGRAVAFADDQYTYTCVVCDFYGRELFSFDPASFGTGGGGSTTEGNDAAHWIGATGTDVQVTALADTLLPLPSNPDYEGDFVSQTTYTTISLNKGLYMVDADIRIQQDDDDLENIIKDISVYTGLSGPDSVTTSQKNWTGPEASDDRHYIHVHFIRHVADEGEDIYFQMNSPVDLSSAWIDKLSIVKLTEGGNGKSYVGGYGIDITGPVISVSGMIPEASAANFVDVSTYNTDIENIYETIAETSAMIPSGVATEQFVEDFTSAFITEDALNGYATQDWVVDQGYITSADLPDLSDYATKQWVEDQHYITSADIPDIPEDVVTSGELASTSAELESMIPSLDGYATEQYVQDYTSAFITSADIPDVPADVVTSGQLATVSGEIVNQIPDTSDMATKTWVGEQGYLTSIPEDLVTSGELATVSGDIMSQIPSQTTVSIDPILQAGTKIAEFNIDGTSGELYAPDGGSTGIPSQLYHNSQDPSPAIFITTLNTSAYNEHTSAGLENNTHIKIDGAMIETSYGSNAPKTTITPTRFYSTNGANAPVTDNVPGTLDLHLGTSGYVHANYNGYVETKELSSGKTFDSRNALQTSDLTIVNNEITEISGYSIAGDELPDDLVTSGQLATVSGAIEADIPSYTAGDNISIVNDEISVSGTTGLVAGDNISITASGDNYVISSSGGGGSVTFPLEVSGSTNVYEARDGLTSGYVNAGEIYVGYHGDHGSGGEPDSAAVSINPYRIGVKADWGGTHPIMTAIYPGYIEFGDNEGHSHPLDFNNVDEWNSVYDAVNDSATYWNSTYNAVNDSASYWNDAAGMNEYPISAGPGMSIEDVDGVTVFSCTGGDVPDDVVTSGQLATVSGNIMNEIPDLTGYATQTWVSDGFMETSGLEYNSQDEISGYNGHPVMTVDSEKQWLTHDDTIAHVTNSAQYAFGVNVPVVAQAMGTDETELWSGTRTSACTLSEPANSFERIRIEKSIGTDTLSSTSKSNISFSDSVSSDNDVLLAIGRFTVSGTSVTVTRSKTIVFGTWSDTTTSPTVRNDWDWGKNIITKVVGIGRKENT